MNSLYPILRKVLVQVTKIATTVLLLIVLIDYFEKLIAFKFESVYEGTDGYYYLYTPISFTIAEYIQISFIIIPCTEEAVKSIEEVDVWKNR